MSTDSRLFLTSPLVHPDAAALDLDKVLADYARDGYARLGRVLRDEAIADLRARVDDLMFGRRVYPGMFFQRDSETGSYDDLRFKRGYEGPGDIAIIGGAAEVEDRIHGLTTAGVTTFAASEFGSRDQRGATRELLVSML